ncbi:beta-ketoacyl synthase N-terminal-like domain-containing protein [Nocardia sp. NPDC004604]|uniref:beta-ketoacyl synthase N-terminal-like domain-containing protein n=1 Tax=Nocardia sp. NPDC004604 TaxID=3157013 RepID=UPI0033A7644E
MTRRAVITGIGIVAPSGTSASEHWKTVMAGENRIAPITHFDASGYSTTLAGEVRDFVPELHMDRRLIVQTDRWTWMSMAATTQALADAELDPSSLDPYQMSVALASSSGGNHFGQQELQRLWSGEKRTVGTYQSIAWFYAASVGQTSILHQMKGPSSVLVSEAAGGLDSLGYAARAIRRGTDVVLAGGTEAPLGPYALTCLQRSGWLSRQKDPARGYLPFDVAAAGYVPGEGGAIFVVEEEQHALRRGAPYVYAEVAGYAANHDGRTSHPCGDMTGEQPSNYLAAALRGALRRAQTSPGRTDVLFADSAGVPAADRAEANAIRAVFPDGVPVTGQKGLLGRAAHGSSALDVATAVLAMREQTLPAFGALVNPAPGCELDFIAAPQRAAVHVAAVAARGYDGFNSALILRRPQGVRQ